jgi:epoxyqueuosine reductase
MRWSEAEFLRHTEGSAIRRIGHERWQRNIAVAMGNALRDARLSASQSHDIRASLQEALRTSTPLVQEHIHWALEAKQTQSY